VDARTDLGRRGEDAAAAFYERNGYRVVDRNFRCNAGELDLVAAGRGVIVFCEVKTRATDHFGLPAEAVSIRKQGRLRRLAARWLEQRRPGAADVRFDVVSVIVRDGRLQLTHIPDAF
jgi:putative endonuclease